MFLAYDAAARPSRPTFKNIEVQAYIVQNRSKSKAYSLSWLNIYLF